MPMSTEPGKRSKFYTFCARIIQRLSSLTCHMMSPKAAVSNTMIVNQLHLGTSSYGTSSIVRPSSNSKLELNVLYVHIEISIKPPQREPFCQLETIQE
jgi:hypothetical protein